MNKITIIGTEPPCPRCGLLYALVKQKVKELKLEVEIEKSAYTNDRAREIAAKYGLEPGTAKDVAKKLGAEMDKRELARLMRETEPDPECEYCDYNKFNWSKQLDDFLKPFEIRAEQHGFLMTPVLIINGEVKHAGSVPSMQSLESWLNKIDK